MDKGIDKSQIDKAISDLDTSDKRVSRKAFNFLLSRVGIEITDYQDQVRIENKVVELASSTDMEVRRHIGNMCNTIICNTNPELALTLAILSGIEDNARRNEIRSNRALIGSNHPIRCLEIIQCWWRTNVLQIGARLCGILQEIAEGDANIVNGFLRSWIAGENDYEILTYGLPNLLRDMFYWSDKRRLVDLFASTDLDLGDIRQLRIVCRTLNTVLCSLLNDPRQCKGDFIAEFIAECSNFVSTLAASKDIDITKIVESRQRREVIRILAIVKSIENPKRNVDFVTVNNNLNYFPNIQYLLSKRLWFERAINRGDASHPLIPLLEMKKPDASSMLKYIDSALALVLKDKNTGLRRLGNGFQDASAFFSTVGELVVCAHFKSSFGGTEIQYDDTGDKVPDCKVNIDGDEILVEVKSLELLPELKYCTVIADIKRNRVKDAIKKKLKEQISSIAAVTDMPIFIVVNITDAIDIDDIDLEAVFRGTMQYEPVLDPQGNVVGVSRSRAKDSIAQEPKYKLVSGIIICRADPDDNDNQMRLLGEIHKNPDANVPVDDRLIERIKNGIFNNPLPDSVSS